MYLVSPYPQVALSDLGALTDMEALADLGALAGLGALVDLGGLIDLGAVPSMCTLACPGRVQTGPGRAQKQKICPEWFYRSSAPLGPLLHTQQCITNIILMGQRVHNTYATVLH